MVKSTLPDDEKVLADRLRHEAEASQPEFSEALHARICQAVQTGKTSPRRPAARSPRPIEYVCLLATCLVVALVVAWQLTGPEPAPTPNPDNVAVTPKHHEPLHVENEVPDDFMPAELALPLQDWADLDHDARMVAQLLFDPLPLNALAANRDP